MKAWLMDGTNGIDKLHLGDVPDPVAAPGEVVLEVLYTAVNPADRYMTEGQYPANPPLPHILGRDGLGIVKQIGRGVSGWRVGQTAVLLRSEVGIERAGMFAMAAAVPAESLVEVPAGWSEQEAAGAALIYLTAHQALTQWGELPPSVVLVTGASGGMGTAITQLAHAIGHTVIGLSRSAEKARKVKELGAVAVFDPEDAQWRKKLKDVLGDRRVDLAIDQLGGSFFPQVVDVMGNGGKISVVGRLAGPVPQFNTASLFFRRLRIGGVAMSSYTNAQSRAAWKEILQWLGRTGAKTVVDQVFSFEQLPAAFARLKEGPMGKVLVKVKA